MVITLATLKDATEQEVFNQVGAHLLKQNARAINDGTCQYRTSGGLKCAAGCLIGDDEYIEGFEDKMWLDLCRDGMVSDKHQELISRLQTIHDVTSIATWYRSLELTAEDLHLSMEELVRWKKT
jgi:hypothetical protein